MQRDSFDDEITGDVVLSLLHIENIALIEVADVRFGRGFNALTGETGAGKSIVIDSISAVLGERTSRDLIRTGAKSAYVSAVFSDLPPMTWFEEMGIAPDENGELLLEREIQGDGKNVCRVNGRPLTVTQLRGLGQQILNIHGQHDGQQLLNEECHLEYLDRFGDTAQLHRAYLSCYEAMMVTRREMHTLRMDDAEKSRRIDTLTYQINELERAQLQPGEDETLAAKKSILRNAGKMIGALETAEFALDGAGEQEGAVSLLAAAGDAVAQAARCVQEGDQAEQLKEMAERLVQMRYEAFDMLEVCRDMRSELDVSPEEIDRMESRLDLLYRLGKKYGSSVEEMLTYLQKCKEELDQIQYSSDHIQLLEHQFEQQRKQAKVAAEHLSKARRAVANQLQTRIQKELADLDMPKVRFEVCIEPKEGELGMDASGMDQVRFLMSANVGEDLKPINRIASGGELSRIMLALKNVLAESDDVSTLVFDEVDTGVSGRAAVKVAKKMAQVAQQKQILCVTHLPQIAAMADTHFYIQKGERKGRTFTDISELSDGDRAIELSRLTGGEHVTKAMLDGSKELLNEANMFKNELKVKN